MATIRIKRAHSAICSGCGIHGRCSDYDTTRIIMKAIRKIEKKDAKREAEEELD
jgi:hypothetical protein